MAGFFLLNTPVMKLYKVVISFTFYLFILSPIRISVHFSSRLVLLVPKELPVLASTAKKEEKSASFYQRVCKFLLRIDLEPFENGIVWWGMEKKNFFFEKKKKERTNFFSALSHWQRPCASHPSWHSGNTTPPSRPNRLPCRVFYGKIPL